jgi:hypothetical protein
VTPLRRSARIAASRPPSASTISMFSMTPSRNVSSSWTESP